MTDLDVLEGKWTNALHPRDKLGRFASKGAGSLSASTRRLGSAAGRIGGVLTASARRLAANTAKAASETQFRRALVSKVDPATGAVSVQRRTIHDHSVLRRGARTVGRVLKTKEGRVLAGGATAIGGVVAGRNMLPGARKQRDQARLVKYHRNSRIAWQKHQRITTKSGQEASPGQGVRVGHLRRKATYLGAEWRPQGRIPTTTGRLLVQGRGRIKAVPFSKIKSARKGSVMSPAEAMAKASQHSLTKRTWQRRPPSGAQAMRIAIARKNEKRVKFELRNEIRNLRRSGSFPERVAARFGERLASQYFSKTMRRQRKRHRRPNARANNAIRAGKP
ncbi:MAG: hypothetical protein IPG34_20020 [Rhodocyclaceae bacterium]|nr:hypothetical protein [Rhodocyclaceae bacterium]